MTFPPPNWPTQGQTLDSSWTPDARRQTVVQIARAVVGLAPTDRTYHELCYPHDAPAQAAQMARGQSACALVCAGILRCMGFEHPLLDEPYAKQYLRMDAMSRLRSMGHWYANPSRLPLPGEMAIIGIGLGTHALTCVGGDDEWLESVDGGRSAIRVARRQIVRSGGRVGLRDSMGTRWVVGVLACGEMAATVEWCLPER